MELDCQDRDIFLLHHTDLFDCCVTRRERDLFDQMSILLTHEDNVPVDHYLNLV